MDYIPNLFKDHSTELSRTPVIYISWSEELTLHFHSSLEILRRKVSIVAEQMLTQSEGS